MRRLMKSEEIARFKVREDLRIAWDRISHIIVWFRDLELRLGALPTEDIMELVHEEGP